jgi:hypothetical protein
MNRHRFLGSTDLGVVSSLLTNYNVPTKISDGIKLNKIKHQDDLILIELGTLLTPNECDEIISNIRQETFEQMSNKYDVRKRNSSRLVVMDDRLGRTLWRRLKFSNKLTKLVRDTKPLGFNVQGQWTMSGVNAAMRLNKYNHGDYFAPHKDAQYAPSGDERSLLSLLIYLNDNYEKGETKFYFPRQSPKSDVKGLTIAEEIEAYGGLENGFECVTLKPKQGFAVLFTHNLLHEATPPEIPNSLARIERLVLRTDVLVKRKDKPLGFAICSEEKEDYLACLNFFREAQQNELKSYENDGMSVTGELYERSSSIRYCYPRLLQSKLKQTTNNKDEQKPLIHQLPSELWLHIFKFLHEQDVQHLIFAFPQFQLLKMVWDAQETKAFVTDPSRPKFIPIIKTQYGSRTLFRFPDSDFFYQHIDGCCRVAAVYAFFLLGHGKDSTTYIVRYDQNTQEVCEVQMERVLADAFYNRNCYGSLYRVKQKEKERRQPIVDFDHSVDRTYLTNRHQSQFIGQDLLSRFHLTIKSSDSSDSEANDDENQPRKSELLFHQRKHAWYDSKNKLVDHNLESCNSEPCDSERTNDTKLSYCEHLLKQTEKDSGTSLFRMISAKDPFLYPVCGCGMGSNYSSERVRGFMRFYNHLIFDFDSHQLTVERLSDRELSNSLSYDGIWTLERLVQEKSPISFYRVNIEHLAKKTKGFNHASCQCAYPYVEIDQFSFLDYTQLSHVHLAVGQNSDHVFVLATYGGIAAF